MKAEEIAGLWIDGLAPCCEPGENKRRLASDFKEFANQQLAEIQKLFDTKLLPIDPIPGNILKIAKAVSEIYDEIKKMQGLT